MNKIHVVTIDLVYSPNGQLLYQFVHGRARITVALQEAMHKDLIGNALACEVEKKRGALFLELYQVREERKVSQKMKWARLAR